MPPDDLSPTEQAVHDAFRTGEYLRLDSAGDTGVRSSVLRFLLLGGVPVEGGCLPALRLAGAHIIGQLQLAYADVVAPISLRDCRVDGSLDIYGAHLRQFSLRRCTFPGLIASNATFSANLRITDCRSTGALDLVGAHISNAFILDGTRVDPPPTTDGTEPGPALDGTRLRVGADFLARQGFRCRGTVRLTNAEVGGSLRWEGATLENPGGSALFAPDLRVGAFANLCAGLVADGSVSLRHAQITSRLTFEQATLAGGEGSTLDLAHLQTRDLTLLPARSTVGAIDLSHARVGLLRDDPSTWPREVRLDGLTYEALSDAGATNQRLTWLRRDPRGYRPQTYGQLASVYRGAGRDDDGREVLLAGERHRRETLAPSGRAWGYLQDLTVGYGYRPGWAVLWLVALQLIGTAVFSLHPPRAAEPAKAPDFVAFAYTADLVLPVLDLGQQSAYHARGASVWLAYVLILAGVLFATTITAAAARRLRRA